MSLQSDFELCLEYAESLEAKQEQRVHAQNNIIFTQNESRRLKSKLQFCTTLSVLSAIGALVFALIMISIHSVDSLALLPCLLVTFAVFLVSLFNRIRTKKESDEFEAGKLLFIQQYTAEAEECEREIMRLIKEIYQENLIDIVPADYFYTAAIEFCLIQIRKKLANNATEAFQQLESEIERSEQMEYLEQMNNARMEQLNDIKRAIDINTLVTLAGQNKEYT